MISQHTAYTPLMPERQQRKKKTLVLAAAGIGICMIVAAVVILAQPSSSNKPNPADQLSKQLASQAAGGVVELNEETIGTKAANMLQGNLGVAKLSVRQPLVSEVDSTSLGTKLVTLSGSTDFNGVTFDVSCGFHFIENELHFTAHLISPKQSIENDESSVPITSLLPSGEIPASYADIYVRSPILSVATHKGYDPLSGRVLSSGTNLNAQLDQDATTDPVVDVIREILATLEDVPARIIGTLVNITGALYPDIILNATTSPGYRFPIGKYLYFENITQFIDPAKSEAEISAGMILAPPKMDNLTMKWDGKASWASAKTINLNGVQVGDWKMLPNMPTDLVMTLATVTSSITFNDGSDPTVTGNIVCKLTYGEAVGSVEIDLPPAENVATPNGDYAFAIAALVLDEHLFEHLPIAKNKDAPALSVTKGAFVFTPVAGTYTFQYPDFAPNPTEPVVAGFNLFASVDIKQSDSLAPLASLQTNTDTQIFLAGDLQLSGDFTLSGEILNYVGKDDDYTVDQATLTISSLFGPNKNMLGLSLDAHVVVAASTFQTASDIDFVVSGDIDEQRVDLKGKATGDVQVTIPIAKHTVDIDDLDITFSHDPTDTIPTHVSILMSAESESITLNFNYPGDNQQTHACPILSFADANFYSLNTFMQKYAPDIDSTFGGVATSVLNDVAGTQLGDVILSVNPFCGNVTIAAELSSSSSGAAVLGAYLEQICTTYPCDAKWEFHVFVVPLSSSYSMDGFSQSVLPVDLCLPAFILSTAPGKVGIPLSYMKDNPCVGAKGSPLSINYTIMVDTSDGLTVVAVLMITDSKNAKFLNGLIPAQTVEVEVLGHIMDGWALDIQLGDKGMDLGNNITLSAAYLGISSDSGVLFGAQLTALAPCFSASGCTQNWLEAAVEGTYDDGEFTLKGTADTSAKIPFPIGNSGVQIEQLGFVIDVSAPDSTGKRTAVTASLTGEIVVGSAKIQVEFDLLSNYVVKFEGKVTEAPALPLGDFIKLIIGDSAFDNLPLPSSVASAIENDWAFDTLDITFISSPISISASGSMTVYGESNVEAVVKVGQDSSSNWQWLVGLRLDVGSKSFSTIVPGVTSLDNLQFASVAVIVSSESASVSFPDASGSYNALQGFNFYATLTLANSGIQGLESFAQFTGLTTLDVTAQIASETQFSIHADATGNMKIFNDRIDLTAAGFFITVQAANVQFGLETDAVIAVTSRASDQLDFHGDLYVATSGLGFDVAMTNDWVNPLGIPGVTISATDLSLELSWAWVPDAVGLAGGLHIDDVGGDAQIWIAADAQMLYGELDDINLQKMVGAMWTDGSVPSNLANVASDMSFKTLKLYANTDPQPLVFFNKTYQPGFLFEIDDLDLWEIIKGSASVAINQPSGVKVSASLDPISLLNGEIVITGVNGASDPATLYLDITASGVTKAAVNISGALTLFDNYLATEVILEDNVFVIYIDMHVINNLFNFKLNCQAQGSIKAPTDFLFDVSVNSEVQDYIKNHIPALINSTKTEVDQKLNGVMETLEALKANISNIETQIEAIKKQDNQTLNEAEQKFVNASLDVSAAQQKVDSLQTQIDDLKAEISSIPWYKAWKKVPLATELAGLWVAMHAADAALDLAQDALEAAKKALPSLPSIDPRIVALKVEEGVELAGLDTAEAAVGALKDTVGGLLDMIDAAAGWSGDFLTLTSLEASGSLHNMTIGELAYLHAAGSFLGKDFDFTTEIDLTDIESWVHSIWEALVKLFEHKDSGAWEHNPPTPWESSDYEPDYEHVNIDRKWA